MIIYTSYFAKLNKIKNPISVALFSPNWYYGPKFSKLAPTKQLLQSYKNGEIDNNIYTKIYNDMLQSLTVSEIVEKLFSYYQNQEIITLLCYEKSQDFCHRHLISKWLNDNQFKSEEIIV